MAKLLILGCGYSGICIAKNWRKNRGGIVIGSTRNHHEKLKSLGISPIELGEIKAIKNHIEAADAILISTPPPDPAYPLYATLIAQSSAWLGYLSTTAVYGDRNGAWVDETTPAAPSSERGKLRMETENLWRESTPRINIFRLAGIYGEGRGPLQKILNGKNQSITKPNQVFGRIHVEDIARIILASYSAQDQGEIYNVTDNLPCPPEEVFDFCAKELGINAPAPISFDDADISQMARSFYGENKRVSNQKIRDHFGDLLFPTYKEGITSLISGLSSER